MHAEVNKSKEKKIMTIAFAYSLLGAMLVSCMYVYGGVVASFTIAGYTFVTSVFLVVAFISLLKAIEESCGTAREKNITKTIFAGILVG